MEWAFPGSAAMWQAAWAAVPVALLIAFLCRAVPFRPATRHTLWVAALLAFVIPVVVPESPRLALLDEPAGAPTAVQSDLRPMPPVIVAAPQPARDTHSIPETRTANATPRSPRLRATPPAARPATPDSPPAAPATTASEAEPATGPRAPFFAVSPPAPDALPAPLTRPETATLRTQPARTADLNQLSARRTAQAQDSSSITPHEEASAANATPPASAVSPAIAIERSAVEGWLAAASVGVRTFARIVRDLIATIPMIPLQVWGAGIGLLLLFQLARMAAFRRSLRHAVPANATIVRSVEEMAASLGLRSAPRTLMVNERVSPLIWCGRRPLLILPLELWAQLDKHGRKAILAHELAHLKRRDHWVCWAEMLISIVYWWHPLVWWIRRRIAEEADLSCDAWVTWLMPQGRRAYAEALLATKQFIGESRAAAPAGGLGVTTVGTRRFARRLTMVMTQKGRPRTSMVGMLLATSVAAIGWMASPALSCPPAEKAAKEAKLAKAKASGNTTPACDATAPAAVTIGPGKAVAILETAPAAAGSPVAVTVDPFVVNITDKVTSPMVHAFAAPDGATIATTIEPFVAAFPGTNPIAWTFSGGQSAPRAGDDDDDAALAERLARVEAELRRLSEQLHGAHAAPGSHAGRGGARSARAPVATARPKAAGRGQMTTPAPSVPPAPPMTPTPPTPPTPPMPPMPPSPPAQAFGGTSGMWPATPSAPGGFFGGTAPSGEKDGAILIKSYKLPKGKLDALLALMIRDDVPVRVRQNGDAIEVHGTARQQEIFGAFISIIHPDGAKSSGAGPARAPARNKSRRADAPQPARDLNALRALEEAAAAQGQAHSSALRRLASIENLQATIAEAARAGADAKTRDMVRSLVDRTRAAAAERNAAAGGVENEAEGMWRQAEEMSRNAEMLAAEAEAMAAKVAEKANADAARELEKGSRELETKARELEQKVREMERRARDLEREAGRIESEAEEFEQHADSLDEMLEAALEEMNDQAESVEIEVFDETPAAEEFETPETPEPPVVVPSAPVAGA